MEANLHINFSSLIIGCMRLGKWGADYSTKELQVFVEACIEMGLTDFDHADIYGHYTTEEAFGDLLKEQPTLRAKMQLTTKCGIKLISENRPKHQIKSYDSSTRHILASVDQSLKALHTEYIDVLLLHRPDYLMNPEEIASAFDKLKQSGKVRHFGVSNFTASQFEMLNHFTPLITNQVEISPLQLSAFKDGVLDQCIKNKIQPTAWSPLGGGVLFQSGGTEQVKRIRIIGERLCEKYGASLDQILIAWLNKHPAGIIPVTGSSKIERIRSAKEALLIDLSHEEWYEIWQASIGEEVA